MAPRKFGNPHFLPDATKRVSREEIAAFDDEEGDVIEGEDESAVEQLNKLVRKSLDVSDESALRRKRRRIDESEDGKEVVDEPILFRLISSTIPPIPVSLQPKPPPPSKIREPDCEDNEAQAEQRREQARAAAVTAEWLEREAQIPSVPWPASHSKVLKAKAAIQQPPPTILIIQRTQPRRATRPPVPAVKLLSMPYGPNPPAAPEAKKRSMECPVVDAEETTGRRRRRRRKRKAETARPAPTFWRPNPLWEGKCRGYAMGYPSNLIAHEERASGTALGACYRRDTMRTAEMIGPGVVLGGVM